jgi:hypothetical protein
LQGLRASEDEGSQLSALAELNELLSIGSEDSLASFPVEVAVPLLVCVLVASSGVITEQYHSPFIACRSRLCTLSTHLTSCSWQRVL